MQRAILDRVRAFPGVSGASWSTMTPLNGRDRGSGIYVPGFVPHGPRDTEVHIVSVSPGFFDTLGIPVLADARSRRATIRSRESRGAEPHAARFYFGDSRSDREADRVRPQESGRVPRLSASSTT